MTYRLFQYQLPAPPELEDGVMKSGLEVQSRESVPKGQNENSPAFQRRVRHKENHQSRRDD